MKPIGVFYATREGQTQRIAEHVAAHLRVRALTAQVRNVQLLPATFNLGECAAIILAASVHAGEHESEMVGFVKKHVAQLDCLPTAFLSVTLSEAGAERQDASAQEHARFEADVNKMLDHFFEKTGWHPQQVKPIAGALLYTKYNFIVRFIMKQIAKKAGAGTDTSRDYEYTDWASLNHFIAEFADELCRLDKERGMPLTEFIGRHSMPELNREELARYLKSVLGPDAHLLQLKTLGEAEAKDIKGYGYGTPVRLDYECSGKQHRAVLPRSVQARLCMNTSRTGNLWAGPLPNYRNPSEFR